MKTSVVALLLVGLLLLTSVSDTDAGPGLFRGRGIFGRRGRLGGFLGGFALGNAFAAGGMYPGFFPGPYGYLGYRPFGAYGFYW